MGKKTGYLPGMDGWRAIAIFGVMMTHDEPWAVLGHSTAKWKGHGGDGVYLFFALSGILITWRILEEEQARGRFDLRGFYIRRILRIQPAAMLYLSVVAALRLAGWIQEYWSSWVGALLFFRTSSSMRLTNTALNTACLPATSGHFR